MKQGVDTARLLGITMIQNKNRKFESNSVFSKLN